jgi:hypothetical protein
MWKYTVILYAGSKHHVGKKKNDKEIWSKMDMINLSYFLPNLHTQAWGSISRERLHEFIWIPNELKQICMVRSAVRVEIECSYIQF